MTRTEQSTKTPSPWIGHFATLRAALLGRENSVSSAARLLALGVCVSVMIASIGMALATGSALAATFSETFAGPGEGAGQVNEPDSVAVDQSTGTIYVAENVPNDRISEFDSSGHFVRAFGAGVLDGTGELQVCETQCIGGRESANSPIPDAISPVAVAVDQSSHEIYVVDVSNARVEKFTPAGGFTLMFGKDVNKTKTAQFNEPGDPHGLTEAEESVCSKADLDAGDTCGAGVDGSGGGPNPASGVINTGDFGAAPSGSGLAVDSAGHVWFGDDNRLEQFSSSGVLLSEVSLPGVGIVSSLAVDPLGDFYLLSSEAAGIQKFSSTGVLLDTLDASGHPAALGLDPVTGDLFASDQLEPNGSASGTATLLEYGSSGEELETFGGGEVLGDPRGNSLAFGHTAQRLYVVDDDAYQGAASQAFVLPPQGPLVVTGAIKATEIKKMSATFEAMVNPEGKETSYHFQYVTEAQFMADGDSFGAGTTETLESTSIGDGFEAHQVSVAVLGLAPATSYRFRVVATNPNAPFGVDGETTSFETLPPAAIDSTSVAEVTASSAVLQAEVDPLGDATSYHFEYLPEAAYLHNEEAGEPLFGGAAQVPLAEASIGSGLVDVPVSQQLTGLQPEIAYRYRVVAINAIAPNGFAGPARVFTTQVAAGFTGGSVLADGREWEMVSPPDKYGAQIYPFGPALEQAAADGNTFAFAANAPTEAEPEGGAFAAQIIAGRGGNGWVSRDISPPHGVSVGGGSETEYSFFSPDLSVALLQPHGAFEPSLSAEATEQTPFFRSDYLHGDPAEFCMSSCYSPLVSGAEEIADVPPGTVFGKENGTLVFGPTFLGATPDLTHVVLGSSVALTSQAKKGGLYEYSADAPPSEALQLVSVLPNGGPAGGTNLGGLYGAGNSIARDAISTDGSRVVWSDGSRHLYLRYNSTRPPSALKGAGECTEPAGACTVQVDAVQGGSGGGSVGAQFETGSADGSKVFFTDAQSLTSDSGTQSGGADLYEYDLEAPVGERLSDLTPLGSGGEPAAVQGIAPGASEDGSYVYFVANGVLTHNKVDGGGDEEARPGSCAPGTGHNGGICNLYVSHDGATSFIAALSADDFTDWLGNGGGLKAITTRVSPDGRWLAFMSERSLTGYDTRDARTGGPDEEVYLYHAGTAGGEGRILCASCNPSGGRPVGAASVPGWTSYSGSNALYQSRYLSDAGRLFFDTNDALVPQDTNGTGDVYEYESASGAEGAPIGDTCTVASPTYSAGSEGCVNLISSGSSPEESGFLDASESGDDVFFLTNGQLAATDSDTSLDVYDAHVCSAEAPCPAPPPPPPPACEGDACQSPVAAPNDPTPGSLTFTGPGNPLVSVSAPVVKPKAKSKPAKCKNGFVKKKGRCVRKPKAKRVAVKRAKRSAKRRK